MKVAVVENMNFWPFDLMSILQWFEFSFVKPPKRKSVPRLTTEDADDVEGVFGYVRVTKRLDEPRAVLLNLPQVSDEPVQRLSGLSLSTDPPLDLTPINDVLSAKEFLALRYEHKLVLVVPDGKYIELEV